MTNSDNTPNFHYTHFVYGKCLIHESFTIDFNAPYVTVSNDRKSIEDSPTNE